MVTTYAYVAGQLTLVQYTNDPTDTSTVNITYDRLGRPVRRANALLAETLYAYDAATLALDTEKVTIDPDGSGSLLALTRILDHSTDNLGRESARGILPVSNGAAEHLLNYGYDTSGRLSSVTSPAGTFTYTYTPGSSLIASVAGPAHTVTNTWEPNRDVLDVKDNRIPSTSTLISRFDYQVNAISQRTQVQTTGSAFPSQPADWAWAYDALGQVTNSDSSSNTFDRAYEYDQIGNRKKSADGALVTNGSSATVYDTNNLNQYSQISAPSVSSVVPIYDQDGNATAYPLPVDPATNATLAYDGENRLISVTTGTTTVSYVYDSQSRRIARTEGASTTIYLYDGWNCIAEYTRQNSSFNLHNSHTWGLDLSGSLQGAGGVGGLLATTKFPLPLGDGQGESAAYYATYDGNGNISEYMTASGTIAAHYQYDPFGRVIIAIGSNAADFGYRFSSKPVDLATALYYYGFRWYNPYIGRWTSGDPIGESGGLNLLAFVKNRGVSKIDILGMEPNPGVDFSQELIVKKLDEIKKKYAYVSTLELHSDPKKDASKKCRLGRWEYIKAPEDQDAPWKDFFSRTIWDVYETIKEPIAEFKVPDKLIPLSEDQPLVNVKLPGGFSGDVTLKKGQWISFAGDLFVFVPVRVVYRKWRCCLSPEPEDPTKPPVPVFVPTYTEYLRAEINSWDAEWKNVSILAGETRYSISGSIEYGGLNFDPFDGKKSK